MSGNTGSYIASCLFVLLAHVGMLINVFINAFLQAKLLYYRFLAHTYSEYEYYLSGLFRQS